MGDLRASRVAGVSAAALLAPLAALAVGVGPSAAVPLTGAAVGALLLTLPHRAGPFTAWLLSAWPAVSVLAATPMSVAVPDGPARLALPVLVLWGSVEGRGPVLAAAATGLLAAGLGARADPIAAAVLAAALLVAATIGWSIASSGHRLRLRLAQAAEGAARRDELLGQVAEAGREIAELDPERALHAVVAAVPLAGFQGACVSRFDAARGRHEVVIAHNLPVTFTATTGWSVAGLAGVLRGGQTVVVTDYPSLPGADAALVAAGVRTVVAATSAIEGPYQAVLLALGDRDAEPTLEQIRIVELLAAQARAAIANARRLDEIRSSVQRLREVDRLKTDFFASLSHELRTPLTVVRGAAHTLATRANLGSEQRERVLRQLRDHSDHLVEVVEQLLDFSGVAAADDVRADPIAWSACLHRITGRVSALFEPGSLRVDIAPGVGVVGDEALLDRAVSELLTNARQHNPPGTSVTLRLVEHAGVARLTVRDDGPGVPADALGNLGQRFFRPSDPEHRGTSGLGLGLALVTEVLRLHGAELEIVSDEHGSAISFELPAVPPPRAQVSARIGRQRSAPVPAPPPP